MNDNTLLQQIAEDIRTVKGQLNIVETEVKTVKEQLNTVEIKVELVNKRVEQAQEETVSALSELIHEGYNAHEKRIKKIEEQLHPSQPQ